MTRTYVQQLEDHFFQLFGSQAWWGNQDYHDYGVGQGLRHYVIPIGQYFTGSFSRLVLANDDDAGISADSLFSNIHIHQNRLNVVVDGVTSSYVPTSYGGQDQESTSYVVADGGDTLHLTGNSWKKFNVSYDVTPNTVIEFDFQSSVEGEIQAIGFDTNDLLSSSDHFFQLFGSQAWWGNQDYHDYSVGQGLRHYVIPIGQYFTGSFSRLVLANDDDAGISADSLFSNIQIHVL